MHQAVPVLKLYFKHNRKITKFGTFIPTMDVVLGIARYSSK